MVSVLMCTYNRRFCLKQAIDSVLCQTYPDFEFVIVDDGSTDGTEELIKSYQDPRIRYFKLDQNSFYCYAANQGLDHCQGDYVAFMHGCRINWKNRCQLWNRTECLVHVLQECIW